MVDNVVAIQHHDERTQSRNRPPFSGNEVNNGHCNNHKPNCKCVAVETILQTTVLTFSRLSSKLSILAHTRTTKSSRILCTIRVRRSNPPTSWKLDMFSITARDEISFNVFTKPTRLDFLNTTLSNLSGVRPNSAEIFDIS